MVLHEKSAAVQIVFLFFICVMYNFFLDAFSIFALFLVLISLIMVFFWYGFLWPYPIYSFLSFLNQ